MNLNTKKALAAKVLKTGKNRIWFNPERLPDIKEALTKQDIRDLYKEGIIKVKTITGVMKLKKRKTRRRAGSFGKKVSKRKEQYVHRVRTIRAIIKKLKHTQRITAAEYAKLNNYAKSGIFKDVMQFRQHLNELLKDKEKASQALLQEGKEKK